MPTKQQLATSLNKSIRDIEELMADGGLSPKLSSLTDEQANAIAAKLGSPLPSLPPSEPVETAKKSKKAAGKIAKVKQEALVETAAAANLQSTHEINELVKQGMLNGAAIADVVSAATHHGFMARKASNDQAFYSQVCITSVAQIQDQLTGVDFQKNLQELGIALPSQTLEASTMVKANAEILKDTSSLIATDWLNYTP